MTVRELLKFLMSHPDELDREVVVVTGDEPVTTPVALAYFASWATPPVYRSASSPA